MKNVGEFNKENAECDLKFSRNRTIKKIISLGLPVIFSVADCHKQSIFFEGAYDI
jgi:hypothetical protein